MGVLVCVIGDSECVVWVGGFLIMWIVIGIFVVFGLLVGLVGVIELCVVIYWIIFSVDQGVGYILIVVVLFVGF